jgi:small subunit ribosomal protein S7
MTPMTSRGGVSQWRGVADTSDKTPTEKPRGPNQDVLPHVSEEASMTADITGEEGPELEQGTPIQEVCSV